jgi:hypothetical protein
MTMCGETITIYLDTDEGMASLAHQLEQAFGIRFEPMGSQAQGLMYFDSQQWLMIHESEGRKERRAEFRYWIEVGSNSPRYFDRLNYAQEFARLIYDKLIAMGMHSLLALTGPEAALLRDESLQPPSPSQTPAQNA